MQVECYNSFVYVKFDIFFLECASQISLCEGSKCPSLHKRVPRGIFFTPLAPPHPNILYFFIISLSNSLFPDAKQKCISGHWKWCRNYSCYQYKNPTLFNLYDGLLSPGLKELLREEDLMPTLRPSLYSAYIIS